MKKRSLVPVLYLYVEAKKIRQTTEYLYFSTLSRHLGYALKPYDNLNTLKKEVRNKQKQDIVAAVIDFDVDQNHFQDSLSAREKSILKIQTRIPDIHIILSNRFWENWIVYHFQDCNRFEEDALKLPIPSYRKDRSWYYSYMPFLISEIESAKLRAKQRRESLIQACSAHCLNNSLKIRPGMLKELYASQAFSYVDILIEKLQHLSD